MKKNKKSALIGIAVIVCLVFLLFLFNNISVRTTFDRYLKGKYKEPFTIVKAGKNYQGDSGLGYKVIAKSERFDEPFVMRAYPVPVESNNLLEIKGEKYAIEDTYPEVIFQNQYIDELRPLTGDLPLMKCRIKLEGSSLTSYEMAEGMNACLQNPKHTSWVTVYLLTDEEESITPEYTDAIIQQMESCKAYSYDMYIGILKDGKTVSEEEYYKNYNMFLEFMEKSDAIENIIHFTGGNYEDFYNWTDEDSAENKASINEYFDENGYWKDIRALDYLDLSNYENLTIPAAETAVTQEEVDNMLQLLLKAYGSHEYIYEGEIKKGDTIRVKFTFNTNSDTADLTLDSDFPYGDKLKEEFIGRSVGESFEIKLDKADGVQNGTASFTILSIIGDIQYPEFTDEFVQENFNSKYGWNTVEDAENACRQIISDNKKYAYVKDWLTNEAAISEIPESLIESCLVIEVEKNRFNAEINDMSFDDYISMFVNSKQDFHNALRQNAENTARECLLLQAVAETENLKLDPDDTALKQDSDSKETALGEGYMKMKLLQAKVLELLIHS